MDCRPESGHKILVADDDSNMLFMVSEILARQGYEVFQAVNGDQALKDARSLLPDLMVLDIMMPVIDGIEVCRRVKADPETRDIKVIMLTAKTSGRDLEAGLAAGADHYMTKPFKIAELSGKIKELLG
ncbi:MAG: response regulator [Candidatus Edwardsbacteria bacterium]|nr:response regulator [Candidatus Edwardsbacteria bacterium]